MGIARTVGSILPKLVNHLPPQNEFLYRLCRSYVDRYRGENNSDIRTNGELRLLTEIMPESRCIFDVGANVGRWTALALDINPDVTVHCFEPSQGTFQKLLDNQFPPNVVCNNLGLGASATEMELHIFQPASGLNSLFRRQGLLDGWELPPQQLTETVRLVTLDQYCKDRNIDHIDYLKIDVEGYELEVLRGASNMLSEQCVRIIQFEYGGCNIDARVLLKDLFDFFATLPYTLYKIYPEKLQPIPRYDQRLENFQYQNWAVVLEGRP